MRLRRRRSPSNVFVLNTGRCGSVTFAKSCEHLTNFTVGHETRGQRVGPDRLDYPEGHIEVDNRLAWMLGLLGDRYPDAFYVHLLRDPEAVATSFERRLSRDDLKAGIIGAFGHGIIQRGRAYTEHEERMALCRFYVDTVTANIEEFLRSRPHVTVRLEEADRDFSRFLDRIGAEGDLTAATDTWRQVHNAS